jgi:N-acetylmuramoyl-L-alanine amidase
VLALGVSHAGWAADLRRVRTESTPDGQRVVLELSGNVRPRVSVVRAGDTLSRLYVDLPGVTRLGAGVPHGFAGNGPVASARVGLADTGSLRVVLDLRGAGGYRVAPDQDGRIVQVTVTAAPAPERVAATTAFVGPERPPPRLPAPKRLKIVIDPGHGGNDPGAMGFAVEKDVTLAIARRLADLLHTRLGAEVVLTRADDATLQLADRTARANGEAADLFLSIHANANPHDRLHGVETYYLDNSGDHATMRLAAMENGLDLLRAPKNRSDLRYILSDLVQVGKIDESMALAGAIQRGLVGHLKSEFHGVADLGVKRGPFYVLVGAYMPCVLVETSFLTHPIEGRRMATARYQQAVAEGVANGVARYLSDTARARTL